MKIDYFKLLKDAAEFSWKYKILWIFGFILTLLSGNTNTNSSNYDFSENNVEENYGVTYEELQDKMSDFISSPAFWIIVLAGIFIILIISVVAWYLRTVSKIALMNAVKYGDSGKSEKIRFGLLWKSSHPFLVKMLLFEILILLISFPVAMVLFVPLVLMVMSLFTQYFFLCILAIPFAILLFAFVVAFSAIKATAERMIVLDNKGVIESIKSGWLVFKKNFMQYVFAWLTMLLPGCVFGFVLGLFSVVGVLGVLGSMVPFAFVSSTSNDLMMSVIGVCGVCLISVIVVIIQSPYTVFRETYWTKFIRIIAKKK
ncbi:hypothetical protein ACFLY9_00930 [Patescibacteria group bacterium]